MASFLLLVLGSPWEEEVSIVLGESCNGDATDVLMVMAACAKMHTDAIGRERRRTMVIGNDWNAKD